MSAEPDHGPIPPPQSPTFKGRLNLSDYVYSPQGQPPTAAAAAADAPPRRTTRVSSRPTPSPRPGKRTRASDADNDHDGGGGGSGTTTTTTTTTAAAAAAVSDTTGRGGPKRRRPPASYAPPATYAHLAPLADALRRDMLVLFVGLNPGVETARTGHAYAHPTNLFWRLLYSSGVTARLCRPAEYASLPELGFTNIVARPSRNGAELAARELDAGVAVLEAKARAWRPAAVCIVGKSIWESIWRVRRGRPIRKHEFHYGWQDDAERMGLCVGPSNEPSWDGARVFVATSTSGLAATPPLAEKQRIWRELGIWVESQRDIKKASSQEQVSEGGFLKRIEQ